MEANEEFNCTFCGLSKRQVKILIGGSENTCYICDNCVQKCHELISSKVDPELLLNDEVSLSKNGDTPTPRDIKDFLDQYVIGQEDAKTVVAVAAYNHYKRINNPMIDGVEIDKSNILLIGPTGCGKTLIAQSLARCLEVPWVIADATSLTEAGYIGEDVEGIIGRLIANADYDISLAERGIVFIDEIDKKKATRSSSSQRDVSGEGVQQALLKIIEGAEVMVTPAGRKDRVKIDTRNILFVVSGAFVGLDKVIKKDAPKIGFGVSDAATNMKDELTMSEHLVNFGLIPELVGRLPVLAILDNLSEDQLCHILTEPKNAITRQFKAMFKMDGIELEFTDEALKTLARRAIDSKTGARGLRGLIEKSLVKTQFQLPEMQDKGITTVIVDGNVFTEGKEPEVRFRKS